MKKSKLRPLTIASAIALAVALPILAMLGIWSDDSRWDYTAVVLIPAASVVIVAALHAPKYVPAEKSARTTVALLITAVLFAAMSLCAVVVVWVGDIRWGHTAVLLLAIAMVSAVVSAIISDGER